MGKAETTDAATLHDMLARAGIKHGGDGTDRIIEITDNFYKLVWFWFDETGTLKEVTSSGE